MENDTMENKKNQSVREEINKLITSWREYIEKKADKVLEINRIDCPLEVLDEKLYKTYESLETQLFIHAYKRLQDVGKENYENEFLKFKQFANLYIELATILSVQNEKLKKYFYEFYPESVVFYDDETATIVYELYDNPPEAVLNVGNWFNFCYNLDEKRLDMQRKVLRNFIKSYIKYLEQNGLLENLEELRNPIIEEKDLIKQHETEENLQNKKKMQNVFRNEGDFWKIKFKGEELPPIKDSKGLQYIAYLLQHEGESISSLDLAKWGNENSVINKNELEDNLSEKFDYKEDIKVFRSIDGLFPNMEEKERDRLKKELHKLKAQDEAAKDTGNTERSAYIQMQMEALVEQLNNPAKFAPESSTQLKAAQSSVQKRIKSALDKINDHNKELYKYLDKQIDTGYHCCYKLDPTNKIKWVF